MASFGDSLADISHLHPNQIFITGAILLALTTVIRYFISWYRLRHVPGPFLNSWTSLIQVKKLLEGDSHEYYNSLARKYG